MIGRERASVRAASVCATMQLHPWRLRIHVLNTELRALNTELRYDEVAPLLSSIDPHQAMEILQHLEDNAALVVDPTGWVTATARRAYLRLLEEEVAPIRVLTEEEVVQEKEEDKDLTVDLTEEEEGEEVPRSRSRSRSRGCSCCTEALDSSSSRSPSVRHRTRRRFGWTYWRGNWPRRGRAGEGRAGEAAQPQSRSPPARPPPPPPPPPPQRRRQRRRSQSPAQIRFEGVVQSFSHKSGWGFIRCEVLHHVFAQDVFVHVNDQIDVQTLLENDVLAPGVPVSFRVDHTVDVQGRPARPRALSVSRTALPVV